jgi:hypothetical protein
MEELAEHLQDAGFHEAAARDLAKQGQQRHYPPRSVVWGKHVFVKWLILPLNDGRMVSGDRLWNTTLAIRAVALPEMLQSDLVCEDGAVSAFVISRSRLILAARYYPDIFLRGLQPFAGTE